MFSRRFRSDVKHMMLRRIGARRAHIVGCERSGTSMLTYAMVAFNDTLIHDKETAVWNYPSLPEAVAIYVNRDLRRNPPLIVTKRNAAWWRGDRIDRLVAWSRRYDIFVINLLRDPRDVLTSKHPLDKRRFYVEPSLWVDEMDATDRLMAGLAAHAAKLTVRYEDIVLTPDAVQAKFCHALGLTLRRGIESWKSLRTNVNAIGNMTHMIPYMHELRDFDPDSIGKWRKDAEARQRVTELLENPVYSGRLRAFMAAHGYE